MELAGYIAVSALLSFLVCKVLIRFSMLLKALGNQPSASHQTRWANHAKPLVGGVAFYFMFLLGVAYILLDSSSATSGANAPAGALLPLVLVATVGFFVGLADDAYATKPIVKFAGQFACGMLMIAFGYPIDLFGTVWLDYPLTLLWVVGIMNSVNMLDNMDGVTGSVSLGIFTTALVVSLVSGVVGGPLFIISLIMVGTLIGYLLLNWHPSKLFMGDTGSQFLGATLAFYGIVFFWNWPSQNGELAFSRQVLMAVLAFLMPIIDTTFVTVARLRRGVSPFKGGRDHTTHHLNYIGLSQRVIPVVTLSVTLLSGSVVVFSYMVLPAWSHFHSVLCAAYVGMLYLIFFIIYRRGLFVYHLREARKARQLANLQAADSGAGGQVGEASQLVVAATSN